MNKSMEKVISAFIGGQYLKNGNGSTDGKNLYLFGNKIAEHREDGLHVTNCGWKSITTKRWLNGIPDVDLCQRKNEWYLNGNVWDGEWIKVNDNPPPSIKDLEKFKKTFDDTAEWISSDGWRGRYKPKYAICGANDTGMWSDSPCPSNISKAELDALSEHLKKHKIPFKISQLESSNLFMRVNYLVVPPYYYEMAYKVISDNFDTESTSLAYICN